MELAAAAEMLLPECEAGPDGGVPSDVICGMKMGVQLAVAAVGAHVGALWASGCDCDGSGCVLGTVGNDAKLPLALAAALLGDKGAEA